MELFSVTCITCRAKLKVRHESAIGQILACPRCQGMVQIEPPPGWKRPAKSNDAGLPSASRERQRPESSTAQLQSEQVDDEPLASPGYIAVPHEAATRRWILIGGGLVAAAILTFGLWSTFATHLPAEDETPAIDPTAVASATPTPTRPVKSSTSKPPAKPTPSKPVASATKKPSATATPSATAGPTATRPIASPTPTKPAPPPIAPASATAPPPVPVPSATATSSMAPPLPNPPTPSVPAPSPSTTAAPPKPIAPPPDLEPNIPPPTIDLAARLKDQLPGLSFDGVPLKAALDTLAQLSTIRINYDWDSLRAAKLRLDEPITLKLENAYVGAAIARLLEGRELEYVPVGDQLLVFHPPRDESPTSVDYPIDDLAGDVEKGAAELASLVRWCVAPSTWDTAGGKGTVLIANGKLTVSQTPRRHREIASFLDRLRLARGRAPRDVAAKLDTRLARAAEVLQKPISMNFRPAAPLEQILGFLETTTGAMITVDYLALYSYGFQGEPIGCAADKHSAADVLTSLCAPREWAWRVVDDKTLEITSGESLRRRLYAEFYPVKGILTDELTGPRLAVRLRTQLADEGWRESGGRGEIVFDEPSASLIVCQHQGAHRRIEKLLVELTKKP